MSRARIHVAIGLGAPIALVVFASIILAGFGGWPMLVADAVLMATVTGNAWMAAAYHKRLARVAYDDAGRAVSAGAVIGDRELVEVASRVRSQIAKHL